MALRKPKQDARYHNTLLLLKKYRDVVWSLSVSVEHARSDFRECFGENIEDFLESVYVAGADLSGTEIEERAKCIERSNKMLNLVDKYIVDKDHPLYEEMEDTYDEDLWVTNRHFYKHSVENPFWYSAATNTFHCTIDEYDKYIEKGAFRELCKHFDGLYNQYYEHYDDDNAYATALEHKRNAEEIIRAFEDKYKSRPLEKPDGIEAKYEQYVQETLI